MTLREEIIREMQRHEKRIMRDLPNSFSFSRKNAAEYCTWWFRQSINVLSEKARKELEKMEKEGIVTADRSQSNNTKWLLVLPAADRIEE